MNIKATIIISSYNYERFLRQAIDSALSLDWPNLEVIVVDDGSTDNSIDLIKSYASRITSIIQPNSGRVSACNAGFARAQGEMVLFLDSDDVLHPDLIKEVAQIWRPSVSKVQCQMAVIDGLGALTGQVMPPFSLIPSAEHIRKWIETTSAYPTPFGSGNIYAKSFLDQIFPLDTDLWDSADSCCLAAAPFFGDVETLAKPLVYYRVHGKNASLPTGVESHLARNEIIRARRRSDYAQKIAAAKGISIKDDVIFRSLSFASNRAISFRLAPKIHPIKSDDAIKIIFDALRAYFIPQGIPAKSKTIQLLFILSIMLTPIALAKKAILWRTVPSSRPRFISSFLRL